MPRQRLPALSHTVFQGVSLTAADATAGLRLSTEAGWNQTEADWRFLLREGVGLGFENDAGELVASATLLPYTDRFAWIGMVLVSHTARRQGLATALLETSLAFAAARRWLPILDATAEGRQVYLPLGFRDGRTITRWTRADPAPHGNASAATAPIATMDDPQPAAAWDSLRFGASRAALLAHLHRSRPDLALRHADPAGALDGFALARSGRTATQIGPIVAASPAIAGALLRAALARASGPLLLDLADDQPALAAILRDHGFAPRRHFVRMILGSAAEPGMPGSLPAIAGPEFG